MTDCNCSCNVVSYEVCHNGCCSENLCELDCIITNLKAELFEKQQNAKDYCALEAKVVQLQNDLKLLCEQKNCLECELCRVGEEGSKLICNLKMDNDNLKTQLDEKNSMNKKLYGDNNSLFQVLEGKTCDNQNLQDQLCHQENILQRLNTDKLNLEGTILNLSQLRDQHMKDIQNLNLQINILNKNTNDLDNTLRNKNCENLQIVSEFNNEKNLNNDLVNVLKNKECALMQIQQELCMANDTLSRLEKDLSNLNFSNNKNNEEIVCFNDNLVKESTYKNQLINDNSKLNCLINDRNALIQKLTNENNVLKCSNTNVNSDNNCLNAKVEAYKKHILILTDQNEKLSAELEAIISRDSHLLCTLGRDTHLRAVQQENTNNINSSLDFLKAHSQCNGNKCVDFSKSGNFGKSFGMNMNGSGNRSLHNSRINDQQYSGGEEDNYSGGEEMQYSGGEGLGQSSGEEN